MKYTLQLYSHPLFYFSHRINNSFLRKTDALLFFENTCRIWKKEGSCCQSR